MQYLAQDLMLLALNPQTGKIHFAASSALRYSLMGTVLLDLVLQGKLTIDNNHLMVANASTTGDEFLDQCLNEVVAAPWSRTVKFWISHWSRKYSRFPKVVLQNLVDLGVLVKQKHTALWFFPVQRYFLTDESIQRAIVNQVRASVLENIRLDSRTAVLIRLMKTCHLSNTVFTSEELPEVRSRIQAIANGELVSKAVSEIIATAQAAMIAAISTSAASSSSSSSNQ
nr:GPP34 family phosphoprotein [Nostoc sp. ChiSLP03a]MDZ8212025.1 GPP34 family phosphoprotein [Nostoc sp. ChiSLP03a]